jgi:glycerate-2-kinase
MLGLIFQILSAVHKKIAADVLVINSHPFPVFGFQYIISIGKAANEMCKAIVDNGTSDVGSLIICPANTTDYNFENNVRHISAHPLVDDRSIVAGDILYSTIMDNSDKKILFLISGGGSALVEKLENIDLHDFKDCISLLMNSGADINELNCVRKHLSAIKGGRLLRYIHPESQALILCDIIDKSYQNVASGLTFADTTTIYDAQMILEKYHLSSKFSKYLTETPKEFPSLSYDVVGDNDLLLTTIKDVLEADMAIPFDTNAPSKLLPPLYGMENSGVFHTIISDYKFTDFANICGLNIGCQIIKYYYKYQQTVAIIYGGEACVDVRGNGVGGRLFEMALAISIEIRGLQNVYVVCSSSDGKDGSSPAAGVIVRGDTYKKALSLGLSPEFFLRNNDSYTILSQCADTIPEFKSNSNLNDFIIVFIFK